MRKLFRSFPILELLKIKGCNNTNGNVLAFDINVPTLKKLRIYLMEGDKAYILVHRFVVRARNLEYFHVCNGLSACYVLGETPFLNKVILDCKDNVEELFRPPNDEATNRATEFLRAISGRDLYDNLPSFPNLIYLDLSVESSAGFALLVQFLNNSPNLEVLILEKEEQAECYDEDQVVWYELECDPSCMLLHLKEIYLFSMDRIDKDLEVIKCLLENSKV
ncbi:hypothetical protein Dsin_027915 [Dipteronia sinensis]|uniref:Uncharacterized protein n=1 Tax=Dipteronia sinensis TaxID=43782 RepID=A0AAD9ZQ43_9ROSI|nr:hypothetical protein Dsin_027915 [Dipteronia sinensis]